MGDLIKMGNKEWKNAWKDSWKGHYQDKDSPYKEKIYCDEHKTEADRIKENPFKNARKQQKMKKDDSIFMRTKQNQKQAEKDREIDERLQNGDVAGVFGELIGKAVGIIIVIVIIVLIMGR